MMPKILIIEDEPAFRYILKDTFEKEGFEVILALEGKAGISEAVKKSPDFILLDLILPGMNGAVFLHHSKSVPTLSHIPIAILTMVPGEIPQEDGVPHELRGEDLPKNVVGYWIKDTMTPQKIVQKVQKYLKTRMIR